MSGSRAVIPSALLVFIGLTGGCERLPRPEPPIYLTTAIAGPDTRVTLHAGPDLKINARLAPALELPDGGVLRFSTGRLTPDSAYFAGPPSALLAGGHDRVHGTLHASVCGVNEQVCRSITIELD